MIPYDHRTIKTNGVHLHVVQAGPSDGPLVILLHGFPEFWYGWRKQIDYLAEQGFWVWAPDQRGYNLSEKPHGVDAYRLDILAADVSGLIDAAGREKAVVIGHDWGAAVTWRVARQSPERVERIAILNVPHDTVMGKTLAKDPEQQRKSWYMGAFQIPFLPETLFTLGGVQGVRNLFQSTSRPGTFTEADFQEYARAWAQPGAMTSMMNWYRAIAQKPPKLKVPDRVTVPVLILWGKQDAFLKWEMAEESLTYCDQGKVIYFDQATHWLQHEEAAHINPLLADFIRGAS
jgi:epoxide hydrolase 4